MKKSILAILVLLVIQGQAQNNNQQPLDSLLQDIVYKQIANELEYDMYFMFFTPTMAVFSSFTVKNESFYFEGANLTTDYFNNPKNIIADDINKLVPLNLLTKEQLDKDLNIKSYSNSNLLFNIDYNNENEFKTIYFSLPGGKFSRDEKYQNGRLISSKVKKRNREYLNSIKKMDGGVIEHLKYDVAKNKYTRRLRKLENGKTKSVTYYKKSKQRDGGKIKKVEKFFYNSDGMLYKSLTENRNGIGVDSVRYMYKDGMLSSIYYHDREENQNSITYFYDDNQQIIRKEIRTPNKELFLEYNYDQNNNLVTYKVTNPKKVYHQIYSFTYNEDGNLLGIELNKNHSSLDHFKPISQYTFAYNNNGTIKTIRDIEKKGGIRKEISYEIEVLNGR